MIIKYWYFWSLGCIGITTSIGIYGLIYHKNDFSKL